MSGLLFVFSGKLKKVKVVLHMSGGRELKTWEESINLELGEKRCEIGSSVDETRRTKTFIVVCG